MEHPIPAKPRPIVNYTGKWQIVPKVEIYHVTELDPETPEQRERAERLGRRVRILYCAKTYELACNRSAELVKAGLHPDQIEFVFAQRDTDQAIRDGKWDVVPLTDGG
jgi:hypothetical protein